MAFCAIVLTFSSQTACSTVEFLSPAFCTSRLAASWHLRCVFGAVWAVESRAGC